LINKVVPVAVLAMVSAACSDAGDGTVTVSSEKGGGTALLEAIAAAQEDVGSYEFTMTMRMDDALVTSSGAATYGPDLSDFGLTTSMDLGAGGEMTMLMVDSQVYLSLPPEAGMPVNVPWITIDPDGADSLSQQLGVLAERLGSSAEFQERFLENAALITIEEIGSASVDGVDTTEYLMTVDVEDVADFLDLPEGEEAPFDELTYTLWVDEDYLPRRLTSDLGGLGEIEMRFSNFGVDVEVEAPSVDEVTDFDALMDELRSELEGLAELEGLTEREVNELLEHLQSSIVG
jgi:hypothetical protein